MKYVTLLRYATFYSFPVTFVKSAKILGQYKYKNTNQIVLLNLEQLQGACDISMSQRQCEDIKGKDIMISLKKFSPNDKNHINYEKDNKSNQNWTEITAKLQHKLA